MKQITLKNYRGFHEKQVAPLAPLTLLVGDHSTGKTSLLAMIRILWDSVYDHGNLNFNEPSFDLGSFDGITYRQSKGSRPISAFEVGFRSNQDFEANFIFEDDRTIPRITKMRLVDGNIWTENYYVNGDLRMNVGTARGVWTVSKNNGTLGWNTPISPPKILLPFTILGAFHQHPPNYPEKFIPVNGSPPFSEADADSILSARFTAADFSEERPFVSAPVRSKPQRTYDPRSWMPDPEGDHAPMLMASLASFDKGKWESLKYELESFGISAGIFDEIDIKRLGRSGSNPFQIQIRKTGIKRGRIKHNLIDVGYGISQVLPILIELLLQENSRIALIQQPEIHLHPNVQAALGSLLCKTACRGRQLIIETHSQFIMDRIRMDVRDSKTDLKPEDVSILFFEQTDTSVQIHSIQIDELGNVLNAPNSYGTFFMEEINRSLWF